MDSKYKVKWQNKNNPSHNGEGIPTDRKTAQAWANKGNAELSDIHHWIELVSET